MVVTTGEKELDTSSGSPLAEVVFGLFLIGLGLYGAVEALTLPWQSGMMSGVAGGALAVLGTVVLLRELRKHRRVRAAGFPATKQPVTIRRPLCWALAFLALNYLVGILLALGVWMVSYLLVHRARIIPLIALPAALVLTVRFVLGDMLGVRLFAGVLFGDVVPRFW